MDVSCVSFSEIVQTVSAAEGFTEEDEETLLQKSERALQVRLECCGRSSSATPHADQQSVARYAGSIWNPAVFTRLTPGAIRYRRLRRLWLRLCRAVSPW